MLAAEAVTYTVDPATGEVTQGAPKAQRRRSDQPEPIDPSEVVVPANAAVTEHVVSMLARVRAQIKDLESQEAALKGYLADVMGSLEYLAIVPGADPVVSYKHSTVMSVNTQKVKAELPPEDRPDLYTSRTQRTMRIL